MRFLIQILEQINTLFLQRTHSSQAKEKKIIKIEVPFVDEISGLAIVKMLDNKEQCTVVLKLKFIRSCASLDVTNNTQETVIFDPNQVLGILDLRSLGTIKSSREYYSKFE